MDQGKGYVYLLEGSKPAKKRVLTGDLVRDGIILHEGVTGEDQVITEGVENYRDGATVKIINSKKSALE